MKLNFATLMPALLLFGNLTFAGTRTPSSLIPFYGTNGHYVQGGVYATNISQQVADMTAMGISSIRQDCYSTSDTETMANLVSQFAPIKLQPAFNKYPTSKDEATAYNHFYNQGKIVARQLAGKVAIVEMMNEPENMFFKGAATGNGQAITDWAAVNAQWPAFRGAVRGFYEGFRSIDTTKKTLIASPSVGWLHYGILKGLWDGQGPDGSTGNAKATWDVTNYHWYYDFGDILNAGGVNTLWEIQSAFKLPILLSEVGVQSNVTRAEYNAYVASSIAEFASNANTYNIIGVDWYELYNFQVINGFSMGLYSSPGVGNAGRSGAMTNAITSNPVP